MAANPYTNSGNIIDSLYKDSNGNVASLDDLRGRIESECLDLARFKGDSNGWLSRRGQAMNEYQRLQSEVTNQRLMFYCMEPLTEGFSSRAVMQAVGMYIGMSLVRPELKNEAHNVVAQGANMLSTMFKQSRRQGPAHKALAGMLDRVRDKHMAAANDGRLPYTVVSASVEYMRIQNAAYDQMRVPVDRMQPPTTDQMTLAEHRFRERLRAFQACPDPKDMDGQAAVEANEARENARAELLDAERRFSSMRRAFDDWDGLADAQKRQAWCECVQADADECVDLLFREAEMDGVGRMTVIDSVNQMIGNERLRAEQARKDLRARQRSQAGDDIGAEIRAGWRYGQDNVYDWQRYSEMGFDIDEVDFSEFDSVLLTEFDDDGNPHYKRVDAWDGQFVRDGQPLGEPLHAREPMTPESMFRAMERITSKYMTDVKLCGEMDSMDPLIRASHYVTQMVDGAEQHRAYDVCFGDVFDELNAKGISAEDRHAFARCLRNYVSDMSTVVSQARADGLSDKEIAFGVETSASMQSVSEAVVEYMNASPIAQSESEGGDNSRNNYELQLISRSVSSMMSFFKKNGYDGTSVFSYGDEIYKDIDGNDTDDYRQYARYGAVKPGTDLSRFLDERAIRFADDMIKHQKMPENMRDQMITDFSTMAWLYGRALDGSDAFASDGHIDMAPAMAQTAVTSNVARLMGVSDVENWNTLDKVSGQIARAVDEEVAGWTAPDDEAARRNRETVGRAYVVSYKQGPDGRSVDNIARFDPQSSSDERRRPNVPPAGDGGPDKGDDGPAMG